MDSKSILPEAQLRSGNEARNEGSENLSADRNSQGSFLFAGIQLMVGKDKQSNLKLAYEKIREVVKEGATLISLPECFNSPYGTKYFSSYAELIPEFMDCQIQDPDFECDMAEILSSPTAPFEQDSPAHSEYITSLTLCHAARQFNIYLIGGSFPEKDRINGNLYNTCLVFDPQGRCIAKHRKLHLFDIAIPNGIVFKESDSISPGNTLTTFETRYGRIGLGICYDIRFFQMAYILSHQLQCKMIIYPGAFNMNTGPAHWELLARSRAVDNQIFVAVVSPARDRNAEYIAWGHTTVCSPWGDIIVKLDETPSIALAWINFSQNESVQQAIPIRKQSRTDLYQVITTK